MGYRVDYVPIPESAAERSANRWRWPLAFVFLFLTVYGTNRFWPEGKTVLDRLLSFLAWEDTRQAMELMAQQLRSGESVGEAVTAFCRDLLAVGMEYAA